MTLAERERGVAIAMLAEAFSLKDLSDAKVRIYDKALEVVLVPVLQPMVERAIATRQWFPKVAELLADAEVVRLEMIKALGEYDGCCECEMQRGWRTVTHPDGAKVERCPCWYRRQEKVAQLGVGSQPLSLPPASSDWSEPA